MEQCFQNSEENSSAIQHLRMNCLGSFFCFLTEYRLSLFTALLRLAKLTETKFLNLLPTGNRLTAKILSWIWKITACRYSVLTILSIRCDGRRTIACICCF